MLKVHVVYHRCLTLNKISLYKVHPKGASIVLGKFMYKYVSLHKYGRI